MFSRESLNKAGISLLVIAVLCGLAVVTSPQQAGAQGDSSLLIPRNGTPGQPVNMQTAQPIPAPTRQVPPQAQNSHVPVIDESVPAQQAMPGVDSRVVGDMRPAPCIVYDTNRSARRMYACSGSANVVMATRNPANGCVYEIPLCIPGCCVGQPTVSSHCGIFGRGIVEYCWPCGFSAKVKFREILGDVRVDYDG